MSNRLDNTRAVVFKEDYAPKGKVIYTKDVTHYIHKDTVAKLEGKKVKMEVKEFDQKKEVQKAKEAFEAEQKKQEGK